MIFEGIEKKLEILMSDRHPSLRSLGQSFWEAVVRASDARILSRIRSGLCDAYLLSESSLFVFDHRLVMITCGSTTLVSSIRYLLRELPQDQVCSLIYERKNENFPHLQPSRFEEDASLLNELLPGEMVTFGDPQGHHLSLFHLDRPFQPEADDTTVEVLMYDLDPEAQSIFTSPSAGSDNTIQSWLQMDAHLPGFQVDDHRFEPVGYSLNGLRGDEYYTVHVTPQSLGSYASLETNADLDPVRWQELVDHLAGRFSPGRLDIVQFQMEETIQPNRLEYHPAVEEIHNLRCGYQARFTHLLRMPGTASRGPNRVEPASPGLESSVPGPGGES